VADLVHAEDRLTFFKALALIQAETVPPSRTYRIRTPGGQVRYIAFHFDVLADETGRPQRFLGVLRDVTDEEIADRAQDKIGRLLDTLMSGLGVDVAWRIDAAGRVLDHFAGGNLARTTPPSGHQWHGFMDETDTRRVQEKLAAGAPFSLPIDVLCEDGVVRRCLNRGFPLRDEAGLIVEWCGVVNELRPDNASFCEQKQDATLVAEHITGAVVRAACGMLDWTHDEFARHSGLSSITVRRMASSPDRLLGLFRRATVEAALSAFVTAGLVLRLSDERKVFIAV
jgi:PAS domain-containing protein